MFKFQHLFIKLHQCFYFLLMCDLFVRSCSRIAGFFSSLRKWPVFPLLSVSQFWFIWSHGTVLDDSSRGKKKDLWHFIFHFPLRKVLKVSNICCFAFCSYVSGRVKWAGIRDLYIERNYFEAAVTNPVALICCNSIIWTLSGTKA